MREVDTHNTRTLRETENDTNDAVADAGLSAVPNEVPEQEEMSGRRVRRINEQSDYQIQLCHRNVKSCGSEWRQYEETFQTILIDCVDMLRKARDGYRRLTSQPCTIS